MLDPLVMSAWSKYGQWATGGKQAIRFNRKLDVMMSIQLIEGAHPDKHATVFTAMLNDWDNAVQQPNVWDKLDSVQAASTQARDLALSQLSSYAQTNPSEFHKLRDELEEGLRSLFTEFVQRKQAAHA